nr:MAG TPA: hypothetical protein [Caudoviricetes sp.]DAT76712.1 MAG TPA: hypothetical protein [Caudoviricetes sp.]
MGCWEKSRQPNLFISHPISVIYKNFGKCKHSCC